MRWDPSTRRLMILLLASFPLLSLPLSFPFPPLPSSVATGSKAAGKWGDYNCDVPYDTLVNMMEYLHSIQDTVSMLHGLIPILVYSLVQIPFCADCMGHCNLCSISLPCHDYMKWSWYVGHWFLFPVSIPVWCDVLDWGSASSQCLESDQGRSGDYTVQTIISMVSMERLFDVATRQQGTHCDITSK